MALHEDTGGIRPKLDEQSENLGAGCSTAALLHHLTESIRDNAYLEPWAVDAILDMQKSGDDAKALLAALIAHDLIPVHEAVRIMGDRWPRFM